MPRDVQEEILKEQIDAVIEAIEASKAAEGGRATVKQLEKQREKMEERYNALLAGTGQKDRAVDFADLGVDRSQKTSCVPLSVEVSRQIS